MHRAHRRSRPQFTELDPVPGGEFLHRDQCKAVACTSIAGDTPESARRLEAHERLGALPSLIVRKPDDVFQPNPAVKRVFERATA